MPAISKNLKKILPQVLPYVLVIGLLAVFITPVNNLLNTLLVEKVIATYKASLANSLILILCCTLFSLWLSLFGKKKQLLVIASGALVVYMIFLNSDYWHFKHLSFSDNLRVWDVVALALCVPALTTIRFSKATETITDRAAFIEDLPISEVSQDSFNRSDLAKSIATRIEVTPNKRAFAIGILGDYGSGKTSFINLVKAQADAQLVHSVDFNPWSGEGSENIHKDFFDLLAGTLHDINPQISSLVLDYSRKVTGSDTNAKGLWRTAGLLSSLVSRKNYTDDYQRINELLQVSGKKILVAIDDMDRLYKEEVLEVLRLIRNTANFSNVFYIVAYERSYIDEAVSSLNSNVNSSFLDKIFQMEIPLPKREDSDLFLLIEGHLRQFITPSEFEAYQTHIVGTGFRLKQDFTMHKAFRQARDVIKFINIFKVTYDKLGSEVLFENLFILEIIKFRFPLIYDRLYDNREDFLHEQVYHTLQSQYYELNTYKGEHRDEVSIIQKLRHEGKYSDAELLLIGGLLKFLFFRFDTTKQAKNSIIYPMFFDRYFRYRLSNKDISEKEFQLAFSQGLEAVKSLIDSLAEKGLIREITARLFQVKANSRDEYELQVKSLFYAGPIFVERESLSRFDYDDLLKLLRNFEGDRDKAFYESDEHLLNKFVAERFESAAYPYVFEHELTYHAKKNLWSLGLTKQQLTGWQIYYFKEHVKCAGMTEEAVHMFYWTSSNKFIPLEDASGRGHNLRLIEPEMEAVLQEVLQHYDPAILLKLTIEYDMRDTGIYRIYREILDLFGDPGRWRTAVEGALHLDAKVKQEYLDFFDTCQANDFVSWTGFKFNTMLNRP